MGADEPPLTSRRPANHLRFAILGSGSRGNGMVVACNGTAILIDCGFTLKETERRLARFGLTPPDLSAIVLTHEHSDHASGADVLARRYDLPLWLTSGTQQALGLADRESLRRFSSQACFAIGDIELAPYTVPHDAREPCQFVFSNGARRLGLLTDSGHITKHLTAQLAGCDALVLECNYDRTMLEEGPYPPTLKARVGGPHGHLDNEDAAALLAGLDAGRLQHIVAAHLSEKNNTPWLARTALGSALGGDSRRVEIAGQDSGLPWRELI